MIKQIFILFVVNFLLINVLFSQEINKKQSDRNDSSALQKLIEFVEEYEFSNTDTAIYFCKQTLELAKEEENKSLEAYSLYYLGGLFDTQGLYETAYKHYFSAVKIFEKLDDKKGFAGCLNCIGIVLWEQSEQASSSVKKIKLTKSLEYNKKALKLYRDINYKKGEAVCLMNNGIVLDDCAKNTNDREKQQEKYNSAIKNYEQAMAIFNEIGDIRSTADCNLNIASLYHSLYFNKKDTILTAKEYSSIENYFNSSLSLYYKSNDLYGVSMALQNLASIKTEYAKSDKAKKSYLFTAINDADKALIFADSVDALFLKYDAYFALFNAYKNLKQFDKALKYHELYLVTKDSVHSVEQLNAIEEMETRYNVEKKIQEIKVNKAEILQKQTENKRQKIIIAWALLVLMLFFAFVILLIRINKQKKNANIALNETNTQLEQLNATQNRLMSIISHDFKAPLSAFYSITNSLKTKFDKIDRKEIDNFLARMLNSSIALKLQLENMLNWSINQQREISVNKSLYNLSVLSYKVIMILQEFANEKLISIENNIDENIEIETDGRLLSIVLNNLIANSVKYSPNNSSVYLSGHHQNNQLVLTVKDNGRGMSEDDVENLFSDNGQSPNNENSGTGLGLIVSKDIIEKLGGKIWAESKLNEGTEIFIEL